MNQDEIRIKIAELVAQYSALADAPKLFIAGETAVPPSGKVVGEKERQLIVDAALNAWLTTGRFNQEFQRRLSSFLGVKHVLTTVSGSAANLLALTAQTLMLYQTDSLYAPEHYQGIHWRSLSLQLPVTEPVVSIRDQSFPALEHFESPFL